MTTKSDFESRIEAEIRAVLEPRLEAAKTRQQKTFEAASVLFFQFGIHPSAGSVHKYTRYGSLTDIGADLRAFWDNIRKSSQVNLDAAMLPDSVVQLFREGIGKVWDHALKEANGSLEAERSEVAEKLIQAQRRIDESLLRCQDAESKAEASEAQRLQEMDLRILADQKVVALNAEIVALNASLAKWQRQADAAESARREAEVQFSQDLESERAARERDAKMFQEEARFAKLQIDNARTGERDVRAELTLVKSRADAEVSAYRQRASKAEELLTQVRQELADAQARVGALQGRIRVLEAPVIASAVAASGAHVRKVSSMPTKIASRPLLKRTKLRPT